ncbi:MAG: squalene--hopene cyclase, partial [Gammaproteobacteria bacterium]
MVARTNRAAENQPDLDGAIASGLAWLDEARNDEGFWVGMLESNCCMEAEWLLALHFMGRKHPREKDIVATLLKAQRDDGAWEIYHDAPHGDVNTTVECYAALRCVGLAINDPALIAARGWILEHNALTKIRVFTRYWLALIGEWPWNQTPNLPPEIIAFPRWFPLAVYNFACWARATVLPLAVLSARQATRPLPEGRQLDELFPDGREAINYRIPRRGGFWSWHQFFRFADRMLHLYQKWDKTAGRELSIHACVGWIIEHQDADGGWGGIQPPWIYSLMALHEEGFDATHPVMDRGLSALDTHWSYERDGTLHIQASESPIWDTLLSLLAMQDCEQPLAQSTPAQQALDWILSKQIDHRGDWSIKVADVESGGWPFERANLKYPDVDDTAVALIVLARLDGDLRQRPDVNRAVERAVNWTLAMQSSNGGWAAFDRDNDKGLLTRIPFCDFGEALDPPSADVTAHVLEAMGLMGYDRRHTAVNRGYGFLRKEQEADGSWFGRWGVNHIYGTAAVLPGLQAIGVDMSEDFVRSAADWILAHQNSNGGWGESCASYMDPAFRGRGATTASQTAWALMALLATNDARYDAGILRGLNYLVEQQDEGTWHELEYTGTGFPGYGFGARIDLKDEETMQAIVQGTELQRGFMINYNLYRHYFPLIAM